MVFHSLTSYDPENLESGALGSGTESLFMISQKHIFRYSLAAKISYLKNSIYYWDVATLRQSKSRVILLLLDPLRLNRF